MEEVRAGRFREDLYYRISTFQIHIPALRERPEDIPVLTEFLMRNESHRYGIEVPVEELVKGVTPVFRSYRWPGNVRELENYVQRLVVSLKLYGNWEVLVESLARIVPELYEQPVTEPKGGHLHNIEQEEIVKALQMFGGNKGQAAEYLGISQTTLWRRLKRIRGGAEEL
jgi:propionate catabolism operon transcriptional regulator